MSVHLLANRANATVKLDDITAEPNAPAWVHICTGGEFRGYQGFEPFEWGEAEFQQMVANLRRHPSYRLGEDGRGSDPVVPWDYEHASEAEATSGTVPLTGAPACGWILDLEVRPGADGLPQLWALSRFSPTALEQIRSGGYRWASVAINTQATDGRTGENMGLVLTSCALTNHPFVQGMVPLAATAKSGQSQNNQSEGMPAMGLKLLRRALAKRGAARLTTTIRLSDTDSDEKVEEVSSEALEEASDIIDQISELLGSESAEDLIAKASKLKAEAESASAKADQLEKLRAALRAKEEGEAEEEASMIAAAEGGSEELQARVHRAAKIARFACINEDGTRNEERLVAFRSEWRVDPNKLAEHRKALLTSRIVSTPSGTQLGGAHTGVPVGTSTGPVAGTQRVVMTAIGASAPRNVDEVIAPFSGINRVQKALSFLDANELRFARLPWDRKPRLASKFLETGALSL